MFRQKLPTTFLRRRSSSPDPSTWSSGAALSKPPRTAFSSLSERAPKSPEIRSIHSIGFRRGEYWTWFFGYRLELGFVTVLGFT
jgi:hypothetical protein